MGAPTKLSATAILRRNLEAFDLALGRKHASCDSSQGAVIVGMVRQGLLADHRAATADLLGSAVFVSVQ